MDVAKRTGKPPTKPTLSYIQDETPKTLQEPVDPKPWLKLEVTEQVKLGSHEH